MKILLFVAGCAAALAQPALPIRGFSAGQTHSQHQREAAARAIPRSENINEYIKRMSAEPHIAGSPQSKAVAEYALGLLNSWGLDARIEEFEALLPYPTKRSLQLVLPEKIDLRLVEPAIRQDPDSADKDQIPTYNAYSATGDVSGQLVYVNYGIPEDYKELEGLKIDVKGRIAIARYGRSWRGTKAKVAQEHGAIGCLIYSDPRDDGYFQGDVYPKGPFRPGAGVQRGSVLDMPLYVGDPLSPGWASEKGARKLKREEAAALMKIPVLPISYEDAQVLLARLEGPVAPEPWRGALPITYHIGPGPATARLALDFDWTTKPMYNVIATIPGRESADEWVIYGNHHDAWVNGAADPVSGAAALLETARALAELRKTGWQPRRTIKLALWDGEEFGLLGSTEWVEKHRTELSQKAVLYLNSDSNGKGSFGAGGSPSLQVFFSEVLRDITDPATKDSLLKSARARRAQGERQDPAEREFRLGPVGAGSDYVAFLHHTGIASINAGFAAGSAGVYHSIYDSYVWYSKFGDPDFRYGVALAQVMTTAILRMTDAPVLPFEFTQAASALDRSLSDLRKTKQLSLTPIEAELGNLRTAAARFEERYVRAVSGTAAAQSKLNAILLASERAWLAEAGLPGRPWYKHQLMAPGIYTGYSAKTVPAIREALEAERWADANSGVTAVADAVRTVVKNIEQATAAIP
jgi:N-acetylated-alpha-linked acidic dipeptidase